MDHARQAVGFLVDNIHLPGLNPINCGWHQRQSRRRFGPGVRDHYILHYVLSGKGVYTCEGETYPVGRQEVFLIRPGGTDMLRGRRAYSLGLCLDRL